MDTEQARALRDYINAKLELLRVEIRHPEYNHSYENDEVDKYTRQLEAAFNLRPFSL